MGDARDDHADDAGLAERKRRYEEIQRLQGQQGEEPDLEDGDEAILDALWDEEGHREAEAGNPPPGYVPRETPPG